MATVEGISPDWILGQDEFEVKGSSFRTIGEILGVSHTAVAKRAKRHGWKRPEAETFDCNPRCKPAEAPVAQPVHMDAPPPEPLSSSTKDLTARGRGIILALMAELEYLNQNASILMELVDTNFNGEKDAATRAKLMKALDHEVRTKSSNQLATALAKLNDAAPSKKEERQDNAEKSSSAGRFAAPSAPKTMMQ
jgi:hypothetical protein